MNILDWLMERDYEPQVDDEPPGESWFDRRCGEHTVRLVLTRGDDSQVHVTGPHMWSARFDPNTPWEVIVAALSAAEEAALEN